MIKIQIKYENESDKEKLIQGLSKAFKVVKVSKPYRNSRYRVVIRLNIKVTTKESEIMKEHKKFIN